MRALPGSIFTCLGVRRICETAVRFLGCGRAAPRSSVVSILSQLLPGTNRAAITRMHSDLPGINWLRSVFEPRDQSFIRFLIQQGQ